MEYCGAALPMVVDLLHALFPHIHMQNGRVVKIPCKQLTEYYYFVIDELVDVVPPPNVYSLVPISIARFAHESQRLHKCLESKHEENIVN